MTNWKDVKVRVNDIAEGSFIYVDGTYREVRAVEYNSPVGGWVKLTVGEMGNAEAASHTIHMPGADEMIRCVRSGDEPEYEWVRTPREIVDSLPTVALMAVQAAGLDVPEAAKPLLGLLGKMRGTKREVMAVTMWAVALLEKKGRGA